jgi:nicotinamide-nucleotide amidase
MNIPAEARAPATAWIIAIGSELLTPSRMDTNSLAITERLNAIGVDVRRKMVVGDDAGELAQALEQALAAVDVIVCTGGLGPTEDDVTRDALARVMAAPLEIHEDIVDAIGARFALRGIVMPTINRRQAMVPRGAVVLQNRNGTAPGLWMEQGSIAIVVLPGPSREMIPMLEAVIEERLRPRCRGVGLFRRVLKITGRSESEVDALAQPVYSQWRAGTVPITTTILAISGQIELHLTATAPNRAVADESLGAAVEELHRVLGTSVYSVDGRSLEAIVGDLLRITKWTVAVAESCTGGLLTSRLTDVPGSSEYVERGVVCYSNRSKVEWLGVPEPLIAQHGAVSEPVAVAMAEGIRISAGTHVGIGVTGIAGPGGGTPEKPVGTVAIAVAAGDERRVRTFRFLGGRELVKNQATQAALDMLRLMLLAKDEIRSGALG